MNVYPLIFLALGSITLSSCSFQKNYDDGSPLYQEAKRFDAYLKESLPQPEKNRLEASCKANPSQHIFCFSVNRSRFLFKRKQERKHIPKPRKKKPPPPPITVKFSKSGKLLNTNVLRKQSVRRLLKALSPLDLNQLKVVANKALKYRCPNHLVVATAATLEDHLPDATLNPLIARLYVKGGLCSKRRSSDREHFYSRAAFFFRLAGELKEAARWLRNAPPRDAFSGRTLYWLARVQKELGEETNAQRTLDRLITQHRFSFHAAIGAVENKLDLAEPFIDKQTEFSTRSQKSPTANKLIVQAEVLKKYGFQDSAATISFWALHSYRRVESPVRLYITSLGSPHVQVTQVPLLILYNPSLLTQTALRLYFPKAFEETFERYDRGVDPYLLMALSHKESEFNPLAVSRANAKGLMQLNPDTAKRVNGGMPDDLFDKDTNVRIGSTYFRGLMNRYDGKAHVALSAYNAGERAADRWVKRYPGTDPVFFIDLISYRETRKYVGFVLRNYYWYRRLYKNDKDGGLKDAFR